MAAIVSSSPLGMWVAEYSAIFIEIAGQTPITPANENNKIPRNKNSYPNKYKTHPIASILSIFLFQILDRICG
jgi:hypothetical protein